MWSFYLERETDGETYNLDPKLHESTFPLLNLFFCDFTGQDLKITLYLYRSPVPISTRDPGTADNRLKSRTEKRVSLETVRWIGDRETESESKPFYPFFQPNWSEKTETTPDTQVFP